MILKKIVSMYSKSIKIEAVFIKIEEWNVHFLQNVRFVPKVSKLKLYLSSEKSKINEKVILF